MQQFYHVQVSELVSEEGENGKNDFCAPQYMSVGLRDATREDPSPTTLHS